MNEFSCCKKHNRWKIGSWSIALGEHNYLPEIIFIHASLFIARSAQERTAGAAESLQTEQCTHSKASGAHPAAAGSQHGHTESPEESGGCSHGWKHILPKSMCVFSHTDRCFFVWTYTSFPLTYVPSTLKIKNCSVWSYLNFPTFLTVIKPESSKS